MARLVKPTTTTTALRMPSTSVQMTPKTSTVSRTVTAARVSRAAPKVPSGPPSALRTGIARRIATAATSALRAALRSRAASWVPGALCSDVCQTPEDCPEGMRLCQSFALSDELWCLPEAP